MLNIYINNEEVVCDNKFEITEEMLATSSTILNNCYPKSWENDKDYTSRFYYPQDYSKCKIIKTTNGVEKLVFCGVIKNSGNISLNPRHPHYSSLQLLDFKTFLSEGETLDFVISNKTIEQAIEMVVDAISEYGFIVGNINVLGTTDIIGAYSTENKTAYDVFQYIADITQSRWFTRTIDENTVAIDFYDPTLMPTGVNIEYNQEWWQENNIQDLSFNYGTNDYRNKQVMISENVYSSIDYVETLIANGYDATFNTMQPIAQIKSITVNGVEATFITKAERELGESADFYYSIGVSNIEAENIYTVGTEILIVYIAIVQGREIVYNSDEVERIANSINRKGVISRYETRNDILTSDELSAVGQSYIRYKGSSEINLKLTTYNNDLYKIGDVVYFESPIEDLATDYMVKKKTTKVITDNNQFHIVYIYEMTSNFNSEQAINYFDNQRNKSVGNIKEGEFITRDIDIENNCNIIWYDLEINETTTEGNALDTVLDGLFIY